MRRFNIFIILILVLIGLQNTSQMVLAADETYDFNKKSGLNTAADKAGYETDNAKNIESYISGIITLVLSMLGVLFLILIIYGGFLWMTAMGNEEKAKKAKNLITDALIGLIIVLAAYAIAYFIINSLSSNSLTNTP
ncbi:MAG: hypothetical protein EOM88_02945 [Clostridia bacterium]|nr:hypothetical protein [Clostridia bacterium]